MEQISKNPSLNDLIDPNFQGLNRLFVIINWEFNKTIKLNPGTLNQPNLRHYAIGVWVTALHVGGSKFKPFEVH